MLNKVTLIGRLGKDPELRNTNAGSVCNFSIATSEKYKDKSTGETKEKTEWHNIVSWNKTADVAGKYLHKGDLVYVEGKIQTRSWEKDGVTRYTTEIVIFELKMLSTKRDNSSSPSQQASQENVRSQYDSKYDNQNVQSSSSLPQTDATDDLPF